MLSSHIAVSLSLFESLAVLALIGFITSLTAMGLSERGGWRGQRQWTANIAAATVLGCGLWSMHLIHATATSRLITGGADNSTTTSSLIVMMLMAFGALQIIMHARGTAMRAIGGGALGLGLALGHYLLQSATVVPVGFVISEASAAAVFAGASLCGAGAALLSTSDNRLAMAAGRVTLALALMLVASGEMLSIQPMFGWATYPAEAVTDLPVGVFLACGVIAFFGFLLLRLDRRRQGALAEMSRMRALADVAFEGIVVCKGGLVVHANASFAALIGREHDNLAGLPFDDLIAPGACRDGLHAPGTTRIETEMLGLSGSVQAVEIFARDVTLRDQEHRVLAVRDIRDRKLAEARIQFLAHHDPITGLPNRTQFLDRLDQEINRAGRANGQFAVICIDLDRFKEVNDSFGHAAGDQLLRLAAERMKRVFRTYDVVGRMGGDEFAIMECACQQPDAAITAAQRLVTAFNEPFDLDGLKITIGASAGISIYPSDARDAEGLLTRADLALYRSKAEGRGTFRLFESGMDAQLRERRMLANDLRNAVMNDDIILHYQPIACLEDGRVTGFEAMARWRHHSRGWINPRTFMPLAEEIGLMPELGRRVLRRACAEAATWPRPLKIAVNLATTQLHSELVPLVMDTLADTGLTPERLELEVTEQALRHRQDNGFATLRALKSIGVCITVDHFGSGSSSLSALRACPIDRFKVDESFIADMTEDVDTAALVQAIVGIGRALGITISASGCDSHEQIELLRSKGCAEAQGTVFGAAMPASAYAHVTGIYQSESGQPVAPLRAAAS